MRIQSRAALVAVVCLSCQGSPSEPAGGSVTGAPVTEPAAPPTATANPAAGAPAVMACAELKSPCDPPPRLCCGGGRCAVVLASGEELGCPVGQCSGEIDRARAVCGKEDR